jgi:hypothetical protein
VPLVTIAECFNLAQGVLSCDMLIVQMFKALNWMPITLDKDFLHWTRIFGGHGKQKERKERQ